MDEVPAEMSLQKLTITPDTPASAYLALAEIAGKQPGVTALMFQDDSWTYNHFLDAVDNAARRLLIDGISSGDVVGVLGPNCPDILFAYYAASRIGATLVPINPALTASEVTYTVEHSNLKVLYLHPDMTDRLDEKTFERLIRPMAYLREVVDAAPLPALLVPGSEDDFLLCYTSGSTGTPKAVMLTHGGQVAAPLALAKMWGVAPEQRVLVALPLGFLYGLSTGCAMALQTGATLILERRFHPGELLEALSACRANLYQGVPTMFSMMLEYCEQHNLAYDLSWMDLLISAGAPLPPELKQRFEKRFGKEIQNYYAMTEVTPVFGKYREDNALLPEGAIGRAAPLAEIRIKRQDGTPCDVGEEGEFFLRGASTMSRYEKAEALTQEVMSDGFFRSGDLGRIDANGFYYITGRLKDIIIRGGANIAPAEVETALGAHPGVQGAAVVGRPDRVFGEVPVAFVVFRHGQAVSARELEAFAAERLADFKVPREYRFVTELPLGNTGKIDKIALKERIHSNQDQAN